MPQLTARLSRPALRLVGVAALMGAMLASSPAAAQFPNLLELSSQYLPSQEMDDPAGLGVQVTSYDAALNVPIVLNERSFLIVGLAHHTDAVSFDDAPAGFVDLRAFHSASVPLMFVRLLPRDWSLALRFAPGLAGDFAQVDGRMFHTSGTVMATKFVSEQLILGFGAIASYSFGEFLPLPGAYMDWRPTPWFRFETFLPAFLNVDFVVGDRLEIGPRLDIAGNSYAVRDPRIRETPSCAGDRSAPDSNCLDHLAYSVGTAGAEASVRVAGTFWLTVFGGATVFRRFDLRNRHGETVDGGLQSLPASGFVRASLVWRIPTGE